IPNMTVMSPKNRWEMADMIRFAVDFAGPVAVRYPRGGAYEGLQEFRAPVVYGKSEVLYREEDIAVLFVGHMSSLAEEVRMELKKAGLGCTLVNARFVKPLDKELLRELSKGHRLLATIEENVLTGGFGSQVRDYVLRKGLSMQVCCIGIKDTYVEHGSVDVLRKETGLEKGSAVKRILKAYGKCCNAAE
ncbi:MAG: 1-deoxy-D-xylulose-5-phosphate synthase, partial [Schaedlerella arabinosiphila]|nr:1-deoxy-D-xylulose-5-phosphate synthase [Schaedlerella arabinosiphila]